jgi:hypothetical protein
MSSEWRRKAEGNKAMSVGRGLSSDVRNIQSVYTYGKSMKFELSFSKRAGADWWFAGWAVLQLSWECHLSTIRYLLLYSIPL